MLKYIFIILYCTLLVKSKQKVKQVFSATLDGNFGAISLFASIFEDFPKDMTPGANYLKAVTLLLSHTKLK